MPEPTAWKLSPAGREDLPDVARLASETGQAAWGLDALRSFSLRPGVWLWLARAESGARPSGFLLGECVADAFEVLALAVESGARRRGVASALLRAAAAGATRAGARSAHLEVRAGNDAARALYAGAGFAVAGTRRRYYSDGEDALRLARSLAECG